MMITDLCHCLGLIFLLTVSMVTDCACHCYSTDSNKYLYFSAQTRYEERIKPAMVNTRANSTAELCRPRLFYLVIRHGSRFPSMDDYLKMVTRLPPVKKLILEASEAGKGRLCAGDLARLRSWKQRIKQSDIGQLAETGVQELEVIGRRYKERISTLLNTSYSKEKFLFQSSYMPRNIASAKAFARGIFGDEDVEVTFNPKGKDPLLQAYQNCTNFMESRKRQFPERTKLIQTVINEVTLRTVSEYLGIPNGTLEFDDIFAMYKMCVFDHVIFDDAPWCAAFSRQNLETMEYLEDLSKYYLEGPAYDITTDQSCALLKDAVKYLRLPSQKSEGDHPLGVFRFTHSPVVNPFFTHLGLYGTPVPLKADNMNQLQDRKWRMAFQDPYSTHAGFVVEECRDGEFKMRTYVNEELYNGESGTKNMSLQSVFDSLWPTASVCNYKAICENHANKLLSSVGLIFILVLNYICS